MESDGEAPRSRCRENAGVSGNSLTPCGVLPAALCPLPRPFGCRAGRKIARTAHETASRIDLRGPTPRAYNEHEPVEPGRRDGWRKVVHAPRPGTPAEPRGLDRGRARRHR